MMQSINKDQVVTFATPIAAREKYVRSNFMIFAETVAIKLFSTRQVKEEFGIHSCLELAVNLVKGYTSFDTDLKVAPNLQGMCKLIEPTRRMSNQQIRSGRHSFFKRRGICGDNA